MASKYEVSPPPLKRRRVQSPPPALAPTLPTRPIFALVPGRFRIFTWNVNGIAAFLQPTITSFFQKSAPSPKSPSKRSSNQPKEAANLRTCLRRWGWPQALCLQEVKIASGDAKTQLSVQNAVKAPARSEEPGYSAFFSLPRDKYNARGFNGRVYGVCTLIRQDMLSTDQPSQQHTGVERPSWDLEGRVLSFKLPQHKLLVVNVYAVNGTDNPYRDPHSGDVMGTRHDHKRTFHSHLRDMVKDSEEQGWNVVIAGDLNIARGPIDGFPSIRLGSAHVENRKDFDEKFMKPLQFGGLGMADSFRVMYGEERKYTYRSPGKTWGSSCDRVDLILLSSGVCTDALAEADILDDELERGPSDHLPSYVTIDLQKLVSK